MSTPRYSEALALAARAHEGQVRKGTSIPYITHPVAVSALVAQYGGDEDQQIAALLHVSPTGVMEPLRDRHIGASR